MSATSEESAALKIASGSKPFVEPLRLGERLKQIRLANRWTLEETSQRTRLARFTLSKIEDIPHFHSGSEADFRSGY